jgi:4'-phosphopantetheinyl transferase
MKSRIWRRDCNPIELEFNLCHSGELALLAVGLGLQLGVDVEMVRSDLGGQEIAERYFSAPEVEKLLALAPENRVEAFFQCWTRKEAYIKARG